MLHHQLEENLPTIEEGISHSAPSIDALKADALKKSNVSAPAIDKTINRRRRCVMGSLIALTLAMVAALAVALSMPYMSSEEKIEEHINELSSQYVVDDSEIENEMSSSQKPTASPIFYDGPFDGDAGENVEYLLPSYIRTPTRSPSPGATSSLPSFSPIAISILNPTDKCEIPTEADDEGFFYWHGSPLLDQNDSLASKEELGTRITIHVQFYESCSINDAASEAQPLTDRVIDVWQADASGFFDNVGFELRGGYETSEDGKLTIQSILPGRNGYGYLRRMHFKVWKRMSTTSFFAEELTSTWYFGDEEEELSSLESVYGDRVIRLDEDNIGHAKVFIDVDTDRFYVSSMSREWKKQERDGKQIIFN